MLKGRLGINRARIPHSDRHGLLSISRSQIDVDSGCIAFSTAGFDGLQAGRYLVPFETISSLIVGPGCSITHDVFRLASYHGTQIVFTGDGGVRLYTAPPFGRDASDIARQQTRLWSEPETRTYVARRLYAWRFGEILPNADMDTLRGMEGARARRIYQLLADRYKIVWKGRCFDRSAPEKSDIPNQALNYCATAVYSVAAIAVTSVRAIPQLGFIHEDSGDAFVLDVADMFRDSITIPCAFASVQKYQAQSEITLDRIARRMCSDEFKKTNIVGSMIDKIKELFNHEGSSDRHQ